MKQKHKKDRPKIIQIIPAPKNLDAVFGDVTEGDTALIEPVIALGLRDDGSIRPLTGFDMFEGEPRLILLEGDKTI